MLGGSATPTSGLSQAYTAKMRPCWPYADNVNYRLAWGDNTNSTFSGVPQSLTSSSHTWSTTGPYALNLTALSDTHGRVFKRTTSRSVQVTAPVATWTPWLNRDASSGTGDWETLAEFHALGQACANPIGVQCQTLRYARTIVCDSSVPERRIRGKTIDDVRRSLDVRVCQENQEA